MTFVHPSFLWALLLIPLLTAAYILLLQKRHATHVLSAFYRLKSGGLRTHLRHLPFALEMLALGALIVALARPQNTNSWQKDNVEGIDIMLAIDASGSMMAMDLQPNRFVAAVEVAQKFIGNRPNDNIGLVMFAGESFTQCPLTTDHATLLNRLSEVEIGYLEDGTAIGLGIATACNRLKESHAKSKIIVLLTDGTNNAGSIAPSMAASLAESLGIRIYTVAVGTRGEAPYPHETAFGTVIDNVKVEIDEASLKEIAQTTGGSYFRATDNESLNQIYDEIDSLEKSKLMTQNFKAYEERYFGWVVAALLFLLFSFVLRCTYLRTNP